MATVNTVATNLIGRWVRGRCHWHNPEYVHPSGFGDYSKSELKRLSENQRTYWLHKDYTERVVAITSEGSAEFEKLKFWILVDGKPRKLTYATVMPDGWLPSDERL